MKHRHRTRRHVESRLPPRDNSCTFIRGPTIAPMGLLPVEHHPRTTAHVEAAKVKVRLGKTCALSVQRLFGWFTELVTTSCCSWGRKYRKPPNSTLKPTCEISGTSFGSKLAGTECELRIVNEPSQITRATVHTQIMIVTIIFTRSRDSKRFEMTINSPAFERLHLLVRGTNST